MTGQPIIAPWLRFYADSLTILEPPPLNPSVIVPVNGPFTLRAAFHGDGIIWEWLKNLNVQWQVSYSAEGIGANAPEYDLGVTVGNLTPGTDNYQAELNYPGIPVAGVYMLVFLVRFPNLPGMTGFNDTPLMIEVY